MQKLHIKSDEGFNVTTAQEMMAAKEMRVEFEMQQASKRPLDYQVKEQPRANVVFFHIPKCAGTSILGYIGQHYLGQVLADIDIDMTLKKFAEIHPERGWAFVGHIDFNHYRQITVPHISFSVFRDPRQRLASRYFSLRDQQVDLGWPLLHLPREQSFEEWLTVLSDKVLARSYNGPHGQEDQYYYGEILRYVIGTPRFVDLTAGKITEQQALAEGLENIKTFDYCLITEDLDRGKTILDAMMQVDRQSSEIIDLNQSISSGGRKTAGMYEFNARESDLLDYLCRLETPIYEAAKVIYASYFD